jgi:hypothetical protein
MSYQFPPPVGRTQPGGQIQPGGPASGEPGRRGPGGMAGAVSAGDTPARLASSVPYPVRVAGVPGTPAASWSDPDIQAFSSPDSTSYGFQPVVEAGTLDGRDAGSLPTGWVTRTGSKYDRESWFGPANDLMVAYDSYLADLAGLQGMPAMPAIPGSAS